MKKFVFSLTALSVMFVFIGYYSESVYSKAYAEESGSVSNNKHIRQGHAEKDGQECLAISENVNVCLPVTLSVFTGWKEKISISFENRSNEAQTVNLAFKALPYTYVQGKTFRYDDKSLKIDLESVLLNPDETKQFYLSVQSLKAWDNEMTLFFNETSQTVHLSVSVKERTPLFGKGTENLNNCADEQPFKTKYGPDCSSISYEKEGTTVQCEKITYDLTCHKTANRNLSPATCYQYEEEPLSEERETELLNACKSALKLNSQITRNSPAGWGIMNSENSYLWDRADWYINTVSSMNAQQSVANYLITGSNTWALTCSQCENPCENPPCSSGFYTTKNSYLTGKFRTFMYDLSFRYKDKLNFYELANEPDSFYLCPCAAGNDPQCDSKDGPDQPEVCLLPFRPNTEKFVSVYGDFLADTAIIASEEVAKNNPKAVVITGAVDCFDGHREDNDPSSYGLCLTTEYMIEKGLLKNGNVAVGIHLYPYARDQFWSADRINCNYYQKEDDPFWLPVECEKAPAFADYTTPKGKLLTMSQMWTEMDKRYDISELLKDVKTQDLLDKIYFFDTEHHGGFYNPEPRFDLTEAVSGVRQAVILAQQKFIGLMFVLHAESDFSARVFNETVRMISGSTPVYKWASKLTDSDYSGLVYKLFSRGNEDILVFWSNAGNTKQVILNTNENKEKLTDIEVISMDADRCPEQGCDDFLNVGEADALTTAFELKPVKEIRMISVLRSAEQTPFDWLDGQKGISVTEKGDVNGDGTADLADAVLSLQICADSPIITVRKEADADGDGRIGPEEAVYILRKTAGLQ